MPISLAVHQNPELPPLAWIAHLNMAQGTVTASVGGKVEAGRQGLVEGVWGVSLARWGLTGPVISLVLASGFEETRYFWFLHRL
jgi:hypothetical protein